VSRAVVAGEKEAGAIPERRPADPRERPQFQAVAAAPSGASYPVWRCRVCGYLCAREKPPGVCPVCKAAADRFEPFPLGPPAAGGP